MSDSEISANSDVAQKLAVRYSLKQPHSDPVPPPPQIEERNGDKGKDLSGSQENEGGEESNKIGIEEKEQPEDKKDVEVPLLDKETVAIEINKSEKGEDTATFPIKDSEKSITDSETREEEEKGKLPVYLFPCSRLKEAWKNSTNICSFFGAAVGIIFQTVGWFTCVGGVPFLSLVTLIIGSIYINDCQIEPNIPVYLIVSGVIGTIQHILTIWTKYVPKTAQGRLKVYRSYCNLLEGMFHLFMLIWFILGCIWVYGVHSEVEFRDREKEEYCHKILYYFAFWILNLSFIFLGLLVVLSLCFIICIIAVPKD